MEVNFQVVELLHCSVDAEDDSEIRILVDGKYVKYLIVTPGVYEVNDMCFGPALIPLLPPLPNHEWNVGRISNDAATGKPFFLSATLVNLLGVKNIWHPHHLSIFQVHFGEKLRTNVYKATYDHFQSLVIAKFARFEWEIPQLDHETMVYEWLTNDLPDSHLYPKFLAHLTEHGRVIGFLMQYITNSRIATSTPSDQELCQAALSKFHAAGIKHGDINKHNFLIADGKATMIDFDLAERCTDQQVLEEEYDMLAQELADTSGRGGSSFDEDW